MPTQYPKPIDAPRGTKLFAIRWRKSRGDHVGRYFSREHDARRFLARLTGWKPGERVTVYVSAIKWEPVDWDPTLVADEED